ncbi:retrovirus-related pol polyprotein from transposon TNT 1-94 [Tanacetum coccineum]
MDSDKYLEGQSMQRPPLFESDSFIYWKNRFETYVKSKDLDLWHVITDGDFQPIIQNPETKLDEVVPFEKQTDDLKRRLAKNNEAKMVIYNALPRKEYERIFMCNTEKDIWKTLQSKVTAIEESKDLTSQSLDELIGNLKVHEMIIKKDSEIVKAKGERRSLALKAKKESSDEEYPNHLIGECPKPPRDKNQRAFVGGSWRDSGEEDDEKIQDVTCLVDQAPNKVCSESSYFSDENSSIDDLPLDNECGDPNHLIGECPKPPRDKNQKAFVGGSWSDSGEEDDEKIQDETCLVAQAPNEICLGVDLEPNEWIKDSGCSKHMAGTISNDSLNIDNAEHVDNLGFNLLSIGQICDNNCRVTFSKHDSEITKDGKVISRGIRKKGLYVMKLGNKPKDKICLVTIDENSTLWHRRLGHANMHLIQSLASEELVRNLPKLKFDQHFCDAFKIGKQAHVSHKAKNIVSTTRCLEFLHIDLFGPSAVRSYGGNRYTLVIVDDYSRKIKESLNVTFDETPPPSKTSPLVDDDLDEEEAIMETKKKNIENVVEDKTLEIDEKVNIKESRNHPLENELVPQPKNMTIIGTKWVFRNKLDENGVVSRNKARLVAQGYNQQEGIDYDETYASVARLESIRILLAYACALDFKLFQMDVKSAFLNGFINEEVYVAQPSGFIDFEKPDHVYKLKKALYGLK